MGEYAAGLASALRRLSGENADVIPLCAYTDELPLETQMQTIMAGHEEETWIIFTDLLGGSVNQYMMRHLLKPTCHILAGAQPGIDSRRAETGRNRRSGGRSAALH